MNCKSCNSQLPNEAVFCPNCGTLVEEDLEATGLLVEVEEETGLLNGDEKYNPEPVYTPSQPIYEHQQQASTDNINPAYVNPAFNQPQYQQPPVQPQQNYYNSVQPLTNAGVIEDINGAKMPYEKFYEKFASKKTKNNAKAVGIICIITAVVSLGLLGMTMNLLSVIDVIFYGVFAGLVLKKKKWVFTLPVCIYGGVFTIIGFAMSGTPSGIFAFVISIIATISLKKIDDAYKQYLATNQIPQTEI